MKKHQLELAILILVPLMLLMAPNATIAQITLSDGGNISIGNDTPTGTYSSSDERLKKNIRPLEATLTKLMQLHAVRYEFLSSEELAAAGLPSLNASENGQIGLLAQNLANVFPELVTDVQHPGETGGSGELHTTKAVNYNALIAVLIAAIQEQQARIEALEQTLENN